MIVLTFVVGGFVFILSTVLRHTATSQFSASKNSQKWALIPNKENQGAMAAFVGQVLGLIWLFLGFVLTKLDTLLSSSLLGIVIELIIVYSPFFLMFFVLRVVKGSKER